MEALLPAFYSNFMDNIPLLTREEEIKLSKDVLGKSKERAKKAINKFVESNIRLAIKIVLDEFSWFQDKQDLVSEAVLGLQKAATKYDFKFGAKFSTYSAFYIRQYIIDYIKNYSLVPVSNTIKAYNNKIQKAIQSIEREGGEATMEEIAEETGIKREKIEEVMGFKFSYMSLNAPLKYDEGEKRTILDIVADENAIRPDDEAERNNELEKARGFFEGLNPRETYILRKRFGFDGEEPMVLNDIGETLNITRERTRQLQEMAFNKIRKKHKIKLDQGKQFV
jgi:RNA polymerase primary sigma factor